MWQTFTWYAKSQFSDDGWCCADITAPLGRQFSDWNYHFYILIGTETCYFRSLRNARRIANKNKTILFIFLFPRKTTKEMELIRLQSLPFVTPSVRLLFARQFTQVLANSTPKIFCFFFLRTSLSSCRRYAYVHESFFVFIIGSPLRLGSFSNLLGQTQKWNELSVHIHMDNRFR